MQISVSTFYRGADAVPVAVAAWESVAFRSIGSAEEEIDPAANVSSHWVWGLLSRFDLMPHEELTKRLSVGNVPSTELQRAQNLEKAAAFYIDRALQEIANDDRSKLPYHLVRFVHWAVRAAKNYGKVLETEPVALLKNVRRRDDHSELLCIVGDKLVRVLRAELETLELMLVDNRLTRHYQANVTNADLSQDVGDLADNLSDLETHLQIFEIGAGIGGMILPILEALTRGRDEAALQKHISTDITSRFFVDARNKLAKWSDRITYTKLDISHDPLTQGFTARQFDIVVAANIPHAIANMITTMTNVRTLLKPRGKLFLLGANLCGQWGHRTSVYHPCATNLCTSLCDSRQ